MLRRGVWLQRCGVTLSPTTLAPTASPTTLSPTLSPTTHYPTAAPTLSTPTSHTMRRLLDMHLTEQCIGRVRCWGKDDAAQTRVFPDGARDTSACSCCWAMCKQHQLTSVFTE